MAHPAGGQGGNGGDKPETGITDEANRMEMDRSSVDKIKLTKFGFGLNLIGTNFYYWVPILM